MTSPSLLVMVADCTGPVMGQSMWRVINANNIGTNGDGWSGVGSPTNETYSRHLGGSNILYADGHAKFQNQSQMGPDAARASMASQFQFKSILSYNDDRLK